MNPDGQNGDDDIRIMADVGIPDGLLVGSAGACTQSDEDVTIARASGSPDAQGRAVITRYDRGTDAAPVAWTDQVFTSLLFEYFDANMVTTASANSVRVVRVTVTGRSRQRDETGQFATFSLRSDVRLRAQ
jgi:hypothetical protein